MYRSRFVIALAGLILAAPAFAAPAKAAKRAKAPVRVVAPATPVQIELSHQLDEERAERIARRVFYACALYQQSRIPQGRP